MAILVPAQSVFSQYQRLDTSNNVTPEQVYYQMLHNDSIHNQNIKVMGEYRKMRTTAKVLQIVGGGIMGTVVFLGVMGDVEAGTEAYNAMLGFGGVIILSGWCVDWGAISKLKKLQTTNPGYGLELVGNTRSTLFGKSKE